MSSCAASYCICSPRASSASATSASSPIGGAPLCCHFAWQHSAQFHPRPNQKLPPLRNRNLFGVAPTVADRWRSSNALPLLKSNSVLHHCWSLLRNETPRPQLETSARFPAPVPVRPVPDPIPTARPFLHRVRRSIATPHARPPPPPFLCPLPSTSTPLPCSIQFA